LLALLALILVLVLALTRSQPHMLALILVLVLALTRSQPHTLALILVLVLALTRSQLHMLAMAIHQPTAAVAAGQCNIRKHLQLMLIYVCPIRRREGAAQPMVAGPAGGDLNFYLFINKIFILLLTLKATQVWC
jgi:hypothetical protein